MSRQVDRLFAASIAILVNGAVIWFLARAPHQIADTHQIAPTAIQIVWITQKSERQLDSQPLPQAAHRHTNQRPSSTVHAFASLSKPARTGANIQTAGEQLETFPDAPPITAASSTFDLSLPKNQLGFKSDPLAHRAEPIEATPNRMHVTFTDRSIGGVLQRLAKSTTCGELRRFLFSEPGSADVVVKTMREHGCIR